MGKEPVKLRRCSAKPYEFTEVEGSDRDADAVAAYRALDLRGKTPELTRFNDRKAVGNGRAHISNDELRQSIAEETAMRDIPIGGGRAGYRA